MAFYVSNAYAVCDMNTPPQSTSDYVDCLNMFESSYWTSGKWIAMIKYLLAPFLFIFFLVDGILSEIRIVRENVSRILSLMIALIALFSPINLAIAQLTANYTALSIMLFFAALVLLGLSHHYKKRLEEWGYAFGGSYFQTLLAHAPLMVFLFIGGYVVGERNKFIEQLFDSFFEFINIYSLGPFGISPVIFITVLAIGAVIHLLRFEGDVVTSLKRMMNKRFVISVILMSVFLTTIVSLYDYSTGLVTGTLSMLVGSYVAYINYLWKQSHRTQHQFKAAEAYIKESTKYDTLLSSLEHLHALLYHTIEGEKPLGDMIRGINEVISYLKRNKVLSDYLNGSGGLRDLINKLEIIKQSGDTKIMRRNIVNIMNTVKELINEVKTFKEGSKELGEEMFIEELSKS